VAVQKIIVGPGGTEFWDTTGPDNATVWRKWGNKLAQGLAEDGTLPPSIETILLNAFQGAGFTVKTFNCVEQ
jgi:hypothetical protein